MVLASDDNENEIIFFNSVDVGGFYDAPQFGADHCHQ